MEFEQLIKERFSCRKFNDKKIDEETLNKILEAGRIAPTAMNLQPFMIYVLESDDAIKKLDTITHCRYGAKTILLFTYNTDKVWKNQLENNINSGVEDVSIVATHIMLAAKNYGIDSCWCNYFSNSKLEELFDIPQNEKSVLIMPLGYANQNATISPMHNKKKELKDIIKRI